MIDVNYPILHSEHIFIKIKMKDVFKDIGGQRIAVLIPKSLIS